MNPNKFRASHSILSAWAQGKYEDAVKYYFKIDTIRTPQMIEGSKYHKEWEDETRKTKKLPEVFGGKQLINPQPELKLVASINEWLDLVGILDCFDSPTIYEYKSGKADSEQIARGYQAGVYAVLATLNNLYADRAEIHCYNQYTKSKSMSIVYLSDPLLKKSLNWIETLSSDMFEYLKKNNLFEKLGKESVKHV